MPASLIPPVKKEFVRVLQSLDAIADVQISFGHPGPDQLGEEAIWIGETDSWTQKWGKLGAIQVEESFGLVVRFLAAAPNQSVEESEDRIFELFQAAQTAVRDQKNFLELRNAAVGQLTDILLEPRHMVPFIGNEGRVAEIEAVLTITGRI